MSTPKVYSVVGTQDALPQQASNVDRSHVTALPPSRDKVAHTGKKVLDLVLDCTVRPDQGISRLIGAVGKLFGGKPKEPQYGFFTGIKHVSKIPSLIGALGIAIGNHVLLDPSVMNNRGVLRHEEEHIKQWRKYGTVAFFFVGGFYHITKGYDKNPFEIAAYKAEAREDSRSA